MKHIFILILSLSLSLHSSFAQNFVPNNSFENLSSVPCPFIGSQIAFNSYSIDWTIPTDGSTDLYSLLSNTTCYAYPLNTTSGTPGMQAPRTGNHMAGIYTWGTGGTPNGPNYREYLQVQLSQPLVIGQTYYAEFYASRAESTIGANNLSMYFNDSFIDTTFERNLPFTADVLDSTVVLEATGWHKVSGTFTATNNAQYLIIGNFETNANTTTSTPSVNRAYYFIDDVCVSNDSIGCMVITSDKQTEISNVFSIYPNPANDVITIESKDKANTLFNIYDIYGAQVLSGTVAGGTTKVDISQISSGMYMIHLGNSQPYKFIKQ